MVLKDALEHHTKLLSPLANSKRFQIVRIICECEVGVGDLVKKPGLGQSAFSRLLARLRHDKLAATRKDAQNVYYSTNHPGVRKILDSLQSIELSGKDHRALRKLPGLVEKLVRVLCRRCLDVRWHDNSDVAHDVSVLVPESAAKTSDENVASFSVHYPVGLLLRPIRHDAVADRLG